MSAKPRQNFYLNGASKVIAVNDSKGTLHDSAGIDIPSLIEFVATGGKVADSRLGEIDGAGCPVNFGIGIVHSCRTAGRVHGVEPTLVEHPTGAGGSEHSNHP